eukprot:COSAG01_NODE_2538_length_7480_cov_167.793930_2_plen_101_part_00
MSVYDARTKPDRGPDRGRRDIQQPSTLRNNGAPPLITPCLRSAAPDRAGRLRTASSKQQELPSEYLGPARHEGIASVLCGRLSTNKSRTPPCSAKVHSAI